MGKAKRRTESEVQNNIHPPAENCELRAAQDASIERYKARATEAVAALLVEMGKTGTRPQNPDPDTTCEESANAENATDETRAAIAQMARNATVTSYDLANPYLEYRSGNPQQQATKRFKGYFRIRIEHGDPNYDMNESVFSHDIADDQSVAMFNAGVPLDEPAIERLVETVVAQVARTAQVALETDHRRYGYYTAVRDGITEEMRANLPELSVKASAFGRITVRYRHCMGSSVSSTFSIYMASQYVLTRLEKEASEHAKMMRRKQSSEPLIDALLAHLNLSRENYERQINTSQRREFKLKLPGDRFYAGTGPYVKRKGRDIGRVAILIGQIEKMEIWLKGNHLVIDDSTLPSAMVHGARGRPINQIVAHPIFEGYVVAGVSVSQKFSYSISRNDEKIEVVTFALKHDPAACGLVNQPTIDNDNHCDNHGDKESAEPASAMG